MGPESLPTDDDLMVRAAQGEEAAYRLLVERWQGPVFGFLERMMRSREEALDLGQETFLRVYAQTKRYRPEGRFPSWLFRIAGNLARSALRRRRVVRWLRFDPALHDHAVPGDPMDRRRERAEARRTIRDALARLPDRQRQVVLLRRYQGLTYRQIAEAMGTTVPAIESLLQRAIASLRRDLAREGVEP